MLAKIGFQLFSSNIAEVLINQSEANNIFNILNMKEYELIEFGREVRKGGRLRIRRVASAICLPPKLWRAFRCVGISFAFNSYGCRHLAGRGTARAPNGDGKQLHKGGAFKEYFSKVASSIFHGQPGVRGHKPKRLSHV